MLPYSDDFDELRLRLEEAKATAKAGEKEVETLQRAVLARLGDCEAAECRGGMLTYFEQTNKYPAKLASETTFRVMRFKKD